MVKVLAIDDDTKARIAVALKRARTRPLSLDVVRKHAIPTKGNVTLADRPSGFDRPPSEQVLIPFGYRAAISFEEQPAGLCKHLSVSVEEGKGGRLPHPHAVAMIAEAFGMAFNPDEPRDDTMMWLEEFEPGHQAVNIVQPAVRDNAG